MQEIIEKIEKIKSKYVITYTKFDNRIIMKNIGKIPGETDSEHIEFLKITNGLSLLDYCFFGLKNNKLGANLYDAIIDLWYEDNLLALKFWCIAVTSTGDHFGYINKKNNKGSHFIGYYSSINPGKVYMVSSSFHIFISKLIDVIMIKLQENPEITGIDDNDWFLKKDLLIKDDPEMEVYISSVNWNSEYLSNIYNM